MRAAACLLFLSAVAFSAVAKDDATVSVHRIYTGRDDAGGPVNFRLLVVEPEKPRAIAILFTGGRGLVFIGLDASVGEPGNFLVLTPYAGMHQLMGALSNAEELELSSFRGGGPDPFAKHSTSTGSWASRKRW